MQAKLKSEATGILRVFVPVRAAHDYSGLLAANLLALCLAYESNDKPMK